MRYFLQKLSQLLIVVFAVTFTVSLALGAIPNAEERIIAAKGSGAINEEEKNKLLDSLNLREPTIVQYGYFVQDLVTLDWGTTFNGNQPISTSISPLRESPAWYSPRTGGTLNTLPTNDRATSSGVSNTSSASVQIAGCSRSTKVVGGASDDVASGSFDATLQPARTNSPATTMRVRRLIDRR